MPTEQQMNDYQAELDRTASLIQTNLNSIASKHADQEAFEDSAETIKRAAFTTVSTARFAINQKLQYTNEEQRKAAIETILAADPNYQNDKTSRAVKIAEQSLLASEVEFLRRKHRSLSTLMLYFANNPRV